MRLAGFSLAKLPILGCQIFAFLIAVLLPFRSIADTESEKAITGKYTQGVKISPTADFSEKRLEGCEFVHQDLSHANFTGSTLRGARFLECDLSDAVFRNADLRGLRISECRTTRANFEDATINGVYAASGGNGSTISLSEQQLKSTRSFRDKDLSDCWIEFPDGSSPPSLDLSGFDLRSASFELVDLSQCDFSLAEISGASFRACVVTTQLLRQTRDGQSNALRISMSRTDDLDLSGVSLNGSTIAASPGLVIDDASIRDCTLRFPGLNAKPLILATKSYETGWMNGIKFVAADLSAMNFDRVDLSGASFSFCDLKNATFKDAVISGANFSNVKAGSFTGAQLRSTWNYKMGRMETIRLPAELEFLKPDRPASSEN